MQEAHFRSHLVRVHKSNFLSGANSSTSGYRTVRIKNETVPNCDGEGHYSEPEALAVCL